jgi:RHS repeat-associated protein
MKNKNILSFILILFGLLFLAFSFNKKAKIENYDDICESTLTNGEANVNSLTPSDDDTLDFTYPTGSVVEQQDVSSMFNERGYLKSNSACIDENEVINDFNGNLQYSFPLFNKKEKGDLNLNISLNYNSSINYQILASSQTVLDNCGSIYRYTISAPGWILNVNGMAVLLTDFETRYLTNEAVDNVVPNEKVRLLATGYHLTDDNNLTTNCGSDSKENTIAIMKGDGSLVTLRRFGGSSSSSGTCQVNGYIGHYYAEGINEYARGEVSYIESGNACSPNPSYRNRQLSLMTGDGLTYVYLEKKHSYEDGLTSPQYLLPQGFYLSKILDKFGNAINFVYKNNNSSNNGRIVLDSILCCNTSQGYIDRFALTYNTSSSYIEVKDCTSGKSFKIYCDRLNMESSGDHRSNVVKIVNPVSDSISVSYTEPDNLNYYERKAKNLLNPNAVSSDCSSRPHTMNADMLFKRITSLTNYNGGKRVYTYKTYNNTNYMEIDMYQSENKIMSGTINGNYFGHGRDLFYTNMLSTKETYDGSNKIKTESYNYSYTTNRTDWQRNTIDTSDVYISTKTIVNNNTQYINETTSQIYSQREYKIYPIYPRYTSSVQFDKKDYEGFTKLLKEEFRTSESASDYKEVIYTFNLSSKTFLDTNVTEYYNGVTRKKRFSYTHASTPLTEESNYCYNPITQKIEYDDLGRRTVTDYFNLYDTITCYTNATPYNSEFTSDYFYILNQPSSVYMYNSSSEQIYREENNYLTYNDTINYKGYIGQLINSKIYNISNTNEYQNTQYFYCIRDTLGKYLYSNYYPYHEGCVRLGINSYGDSTFYYNLPISNEYTSVVLDGLPGSDTVYYEDNVTSAPGIKYIIAYDNNNEQIKNENWYDERLPIINKFSPKHGYYISTLKKYNDVGQIKWDISPSKYLTEIRYENLNRVLTATLPCDFNNDNNSESYVPTFRYSYDDANNTTDVYTKLNSDTIKRNKYLFDGFYRVKESRLYTSGSEYSSSFVNYNYLDLKAYAKDGSGNETKFSYDEMMNLKKTLNADNSYTLVSSAYQSSLPSYVFGTYNGFINKQVFKDEIGYRFEKYFDAVGNLRREVKYLNEIPSDSTEDGSSLVPLYTDYNYDAMYRLTDVYTPAGKYIHYLYDGYGRQKSRSTPDAGTVYYQYDNKNNLRFSQDENQRNRTSPANSFGFKGYDGINRLIYSGDTYCDITLPSWSSLDPNTTANFENYSSCPNNFLLINVYDTLNNAVASIFSPPSDYYNIYNKTKGKLVATAYRTLGTDNWSYKYYRYDGRGRVIKMWNIIDGFDTKVFTYKYNSQNQATVEEYQNSNDGDYKKFSYNFDYAGRMEDVKAYYGGNYTQCAYYVYNGNSQVNQLWLLDDIYLTMYTYNSRNWVTSANNYNGIFSYTLSYNVNGNINQQTLDGTYNSSDAQYGFQYSYDNSNRLITVSNLTNYISFSEIMSYDHDGNFSSLSRSLNNDNFTYEYYSGTNKVKKVSGNSEYQFTYDYNGNMVTDSLNHVTEIKYDYRNLITEMKYSTDDTSYYYKVYYKYDEAGNRVRKRLVRQVKPTPTPIGGTNSDDATSGNETGNEDWTAVKDEFYVRDADGKEIAIYDRGTLEFWNIWGKDLVGRIKSDETKYFYLKDHLGNVRAVVNENAEVVEGRDYDPWGYMIREFNNLEDDNTRYRFTGKERDWESGYDYFGARYYMPRIGQWGQTDPLFEKRISWSPYNYVIRNPLIHIDIQGLFDDYYVFNENGVYQGEVIPSEEKGIIIRNSRTKKEDRYEFNDPEKDDKQVKNMIKKYGNKTQFVFVKTNNDINKYMEESGVYSWRLMGCKNIYAAWASLRGNDMDYYRYLTDEMLNKYGISNEDIENDKGGFYIFPSQLLAYNAMDAGNFLWGRGMSELGFWYWDVVAGSELHSLLVNNGWDSPYDQAAIKAGFYSNK